MQDHRRLFLEPDWPRMRQLLARKLKTTEEQVQRMVERADSLDQVELVMAIDEVHDLRQ
jgi:hypothetical protein